MGGRPLAIEFYTSLRTSTITGHFEDIIIVTQGGDVRVTNGHGIESGTSNTDYRVTVLLDGSIAASIDGIYLNDTSTSNTGNHDVIVGAEGRIVAGDDGIYVVGASNSVQVAGEIIAHDDGVVTSGGSCDVIISGTITTIGSGVFGLGAGTDVSNSGTVNSHSYAFYFTATATYSNLVNSGTALSNSSVLYVNTTNFNGRNSGVMEGEEIAYFDGATGLFVNSGTAHGFDSGIYLRNGATIAIHNSGTLSSNQHISGAVEATTADSLVNLTNSGTIIGDVVGNVLVDRVINSGRIEGQVSLGDGNDLYRGQNDGTVIGDGISTGFVDGGDGEDVLLGGSRNDDLRGGAGNDNLLGRDGDDILDGGGDSDVLVGNRGEDQLSGGDGGDTLLGGQDDDFLDGGGGVDLLVGGNGNDILEGAGGSDTLMGGNGDDDLDGGAGSDTLMGNAGDDYIAGNGGQDFIHGGRGDDTMSGGAGKDDFLFNLHGGQDEIEDFQDDIDTLYLDDRLWGGGKTVAQVLADHATVVGTDTVLDFGNGNTITLNGITVIADLTNDIAIV